MGLGSSKVKDLTGRPIVVVVGGGYGGLAVAQALDKDFNVVVLERKGYFLHNVGAARAAVDPAWTNNVLIPYGRALANGAVVEAEVLKVSPTEVTVRGVATPIRFDHLVIATGTSHAFPAAVAPASPADAKAVMAAAHAALERAKRVVIVGGGAVGCELAGEIAARFKSGKSVTLVHGAPSLLHDGLPAKFRARAAGLLEKAGVRVALGKKAELSAADAAAREGSALLFLEGARTVQLKDVGGGAPEAVDADLVFFCTGPHVNKRAYADAFPVDAGGRIKVNRFLQVEGQRNVWAVGDCNDVPESKMAYTAGVQAAAAAANIRLLDKGGPNATLKAYKPSGYNTMLLPCGPKDGVFALAGATVPGSWLAVTLKSSGLFASKYWSVLKAGAFPNGAATALPESTADAGKLERLRLPQELAQPRRQAPELKYT